MYERTYVAASMLLHAIESTYTSPNYYITFENQCWLHLPDTVHAYECCGSELQLLSCI